MDDNVEHLSVGCDVPGIGVGVSVNRRQPERLIEIYDGDGEILILTEWETLSLIVTLTEAMRVASTRPR